MNHSLSLQDQFARPLDEPSLGLSPKFVSVIFDIIQTINQQGTTVLLVEQNANKALSIAHSGMVLETGRIVHRGNAHDLRSSDAIKKAYLGG
jgi:branched-chain amino acid transport system ATP-binding protein